MAEDKKGKSDLAAETVGANSGKPEKSKSKLKEADIPEEGTVVEFSDKMWIEGTGESRHLAQGKKVEVQRIHGEKLISKGAAKETKAPPKASQKPGSKKTEIDDED